MKKTNILKGLALINFVGLICIFLVFRNGSVNNYFNKQNENNLTSPNGGTASKMAKDSGTQKKDSVQPLWLSSSKSIVVSDSRKFKKDTTKRNIDSTAIMSRQLLPSSKSGVIIDMKDLKSDSSKKTIQKKKSN